MEQNLEQFTLLLKGTFTGTTETVKKSEEALKHFTKDPRSLFDMISFVLHSNISGKETINIKDAACVFLANFVKNFMIDEKLTDEDKKFMTETIVKCLFIENLPILTKNLLIKPLTEILSIDKEYSIRNDCAVFARTKLKDEDAKQWASAFMILEAIVSATENNQIKVGQFFDQLMPTLLQCGDKLIKACWEQMSKVESDNTSYENVILGVKILQVFVETVFAFIKPLTDESLKKKDHVALVQLISTNEGMVEIFTKLLELNLPLKNQLKDCLFSTCGDEEFDQAVNELKSNVMKCLNRIMDFIFQFKSITYNPQNKISAFIRGDGGKGVIQSVLVFCKNTIFDIQQALEDPELHECMVQCLMFLTKIVCMHDFFPLFQDYKRQFIMEVCLPLMRSDENELDLFKDNPEEFVILALDTCDKQKSETSKTQAAQLLEHLCDHIDGALTFLVVLSGGVIEYSLQSDQPSEIATKYPTLSEFANSIFIAKTHASIRVETCLVALTVLSYLITRRVDLLLTFETMLAVYSQFFVGPESDALIKARICLMFPYYAERIFTHETLKNNYQVYLGFVVTCMNYQGDFSGSLIEQATDSLSTLFEDADLKPRIDPHVPEILETIAPWIPTIKNSRFFDIIKDTVKIHQAGFSANKDLLPNLVKLLAERALSEFEQIKHQKKQNKVILNKIWNIIKKIGENEAYVKAHYEVLEQVLAPLFQCLALDEILPFDEDIFEYLSSVIDITRTVTEIEWDIFKQLPKIYEKYQRIFSLMFPLLNSYIVHGCQKLRQDPEAIRILVEMGIAGLKPPHQNANEANGAEGALLLQLIIQYCPPNDTDILERIIMEVMNRFHEAKKGFFKARLAGVLLNMFTWNYQATESILIKLDALNHAIEFIIGDISIYEEDLYDRIVFVVGCSNFLVVPKVHELILDRFPGIFDSIVTILMYTKYMQQKATIIEKRRAMRGDSDDEDEPPKNSDHKMMMNLIHNDKITIEDMKAQIDQEPEDDEDSYQTEEEMEASSRMENFKSELKEKDEYVIFKEVVERLKANNFELLKRMYNSMPPTKQEHLQSVLNSRRVLLASPMNANGGGTVALTEPRKIVHAKRKPQTGGGQ